MTAEQQLELVRATYTKALGAYSVTFQDTTVTNQRLENLRKEIEYWESKVAEEAAATAGRAVRAPIYIADGLR